MSARRTERLLNLVIALLATRRPLRKDQIRVAVPQYSGSESDEAFERMFERDKDELRDLGVPIQTQTLVAGFDDEIGYRIDPDQYALPPVTFSAQELAVLGLAARVWQQARLSGAADRALTKLRALGEEPDEKATAGIEPRVATSEPAFAPLYQASRDGRTVTFGYQSAAADAPAKRTVDPWRLKSWHGHWYLIGYDHHRAAQRVFRLSRMSGTVRLGRTAAHTPPPDLDANTAIEAAYPDQPEVAATVLFAPDRGHELRQRAERMEDPASTPPGGVGLDATSTNLTGWSAWRITGRVDQVTADIASLGPDAIVVEPRSVRTQVRKLVRAAAKAHANATPVVAEAFIERPEADQAAHPRSGAGAADRVGRLLALVPYLLAHSGVPMSEAAGHFGITEDDLVKDLELLFVCGLPGHLPDDLIEAEWESGRVYLSNADAIARPLRLGLDEAVTLLVGLRFLAEAPGAADRDVVESAMATITEASGIAALKARSVEVSVETAADEHLPVLLNTAVREHHRLRLTYLVASRDEQTEREVAPIRVLALHGHWYLEAWCHRAQGIRTFRFDRIQSAQPIDGDGSPPPNAATRDLPDRIFQPAPDDNIVVFDLHPRANWVIDYYSAQVTGTHRDRQRVQIRSRDASWAVRLALRLGGDAVVRGPAPLITQVQETAARTLRHYDA